jgi:hypothetical protein
MPKSVPSSCLNTKKIGATIRAVHLLSIEAKFSIEVGEQKVTRFDSLGAPTSSGGEQAGGDCVLDLTDGRGELRTSDWLSLTI